jgi:hypothetical protein
MRGGADSSETKNVNVLMSGVPPQPRTVNNNTLRHKATSNGENATGARVAPAMRSGEVVARAGINTRGGEAGTRALASTCCGTTRSFSTRASATG